MSIEFSYSRLWVILFNLITIFIKPTQELITVSCNCRENYLGFLSSKVERGKFSNTALWIEIECLINFYISTCIGGKITCTQERIDIICF